MTSGVSCHKSMASLQVRDEDGLCIVRQASFLTSWAPANFWRAVLHGANYNIKPLCCVKIEMWYNYPHWKFAIKTLQEGTLKNFWKFFIKM